MRYFTINKVLGRDILHTSKIYGLPQLPQFHDVEHVVEDTVDFRVPALVEVAVEPVA